LTLDFCAQPESRHNFRPVPVHTKEKQRQMGALGGLPKAAPSPLGHLLACEH
jgi:hypothetical protein